MPKLALAGGSPARTEKVRDWPVFGKEEESRLLEVLHSGQWWYGDNVAAFEKQFAGYHDACHGITCTSGAVALEIALRSVGVGPGDEVIVPAYTFIATATAVTQLNAIPRFADVEADTCNIDLDSAELLVSEHTKAVILVHFAGLPVDMDRARAFATKHGLALIEDAAHAWGSQWNGKGVGAMGDVGTFSFQVTKNIASGEGGIIISDKDEVAKVCRSYTNVGRLEGGAWYEHFLLGGNYRMTEFQAALLVAQLERLPEQVEKRERSARILNACLGSVPGLYVQPRATQVTRRSYHLYVIRYNAEEFGGLPREKFLQALEAEGIPASQGYLHPIYKNECFRTLNDSPRPENAYLSRVCNERGLRFADLHCPVASRFCSEEMVWLPHTLLLEGATQMEQVIEVVEKIRSNQSELAAC